MALQMIPSLPPSTAQYNNNDVTPGHHLHHPNFLPQHYKHQQLQQQPNAMFTNINTGINKANISQYHNSGKN